MERLATTRAMAPALDLYAVAAAVAHALDQMRPVAVPAAPVPSAELLELLDRNQPGCVPQHLGAEFALYHEALQRRIRARSENERRLGVSLWAEQYLREHGHAEHRLLRDFNQRQWGIHEPASADIALRWTQTQGEP